MLLDFTKGGVEIRPDHPKLLVIHILDHRDVTGFLTYYGTFDDIEPDVCRCVGHPTDAHEHVIRRKHLQHPVTELEIWSAYHLGTGTVQRTSGPGMTPWNRDRWILRVLHTDFKWRVELNQLLSRDEDVVSTCVRVPMPDYDPDSADLGELEQWLPRAR